MNSKELLLASKFLDLASDEFSNHCCGEVDDNFWDGWTKEEKEQLAKEIHAWNGDNDAECLLNYDWLLMRFLSYKLKNLIKDI